MRQVAGVWRLNFDVGDVRASSAVITPQVTDIVSQAHRQSVANGAAYYQRVRGAAQVPGTVAIAPVTFSGSAVQNTITYTSRVALLRAVTAGKTPEQAAHTALIRTIGDAARLASDGARETVTRTAREDNRAHGWQRVASGDNPCAFCAMLEGRGGVYTADSVDFQAHTFCNCEAEPVFSRDRRDQMSDKAIRNLELYEQAARGSEDPLAAFRAAYHGRVPRSVGPSRQIRTIVGRPPAPPPPLSEAALAARIESHVAWAQSQGWSVTVDGTRVVREMQTPAGVRRIVERAADHGQFVQSESTLDGRVITRAAQLRG